MSQTTGPLPRLVVLDLDNTCWTPELYELDGMPKPDQDIELFPATKMALKELATDKRWKDSKVAACSSTRYGEWARPLLKLFEAAPGVTMHKLMAYKEIYPGNKRRHFAKLKADSKVDYEDMIFFDDQTYNTREVSKLGVLCVHVPNGLTAAHWKVGIETFTKLKQAKADTGRTVGGYSIKSFDSKSTI